MIPGMGAAGLRHLSQESRRFARGWPSRSDRSPRWGRSGWGKRTEGRSPKVKEFMPLAGLNDLVFTGWDIFEDNMYEAASNAGVLDRYLLDEIKPFLSSIKPRKAVFDHNYVKKNRRTKREKGQGTRWILPNSSATTSANSRNRPAHRGS